MSKTLGPVRTVRSRGGDSLAPPSKLGALQADEQFAVLSDGSVYGHEDMFGLFPFTGPGFAAV